ncbi:MAG: AAC(3) family N-acetyltransferase [Magnetococcales bacterium]|nr:AAC(3) family N-acetyltransferase [Magnetococcales bacterium]
MAIPLPKSLKRRIKGQIKQWRLAWLRYRYAFGPKEFNLALQKLGLKDGDTIIVHSSMDSFAAFTGRPTEVIAELTKILGPAGTLVMPTLPFSGSALDWVEGKNLFDNYMTPSKMGLITELFRRSHGVVRSQHPTHAVAAKGGGAEMLCNNHHLATTPCGEGSPYQRIIAVDGAALLLGVGIETLMIYHSIEEILEERMPTSPFTAEMYKIESRNADGEMVETNTRLFNQELSSRRSISKLIPHLKARPGCWQEVKVGNLVMVLLKAREVLAVAEEMAERGEFCYKE